MNLKDVIEKQFGCKTSIKVNPLVTQIETTKTQLLKANPNRLAWTLINLGANEVYVAFAQDVASTKGVYVSATGGVFGLLFSEDFELCAYPVWAIADTLAAACYLVEVCTL